MADEQKAPEPTLEQLMAAAPAARDATAATRSRERWRTIETLAEGLQVLVVFAMLGGVGVGGWFAIAGKLRTSGDYYDDAFVHDVRGAGALMIVVSLLLGAIAVLGTWSVRAYASDRVEG